MNRGGSGATWAGITAVVVMALGCRPGEGQHCRCQGECRGSLLCAQQGQILPEGACVSDEANRGPGECLIADDIDDEGTSLGPPPIYYDIGTKRDFAFGPDGTNTNSGGEPTSSTTAMTDPTSTSESDVGADSTSRGSDGTGASSEASSSSASSSDTGTPTTPVDPAATPGA